MLLCDSNVWLAMVLSGHQSHSAAAEWLDTVDSPNAVCFCRSTQRSLLRLLTTAAVMGRFGSPPLTGAQAWQVYAHLLTDDRIALQAEEPPRLEARWKALTANDTASPKALMDAYLAAFALAGGHTLVTTDKAFRAFAGLDFVLIGREGS